MKAEKGENGIIAYCSNCHLFFYFSTKHEKKYFHHGNCYSEAICEICEHCGELYNEDSICCFKKIIDMIGEMAKELFEDCPLYFLFIPFISLFLFFVIIFRNIFSKRIKKRDDVNYTYHIFDNEDIKIFRIIVFPLCLIYTLVFLIPYHYIYFFHLCYWIKLRNQFLKENENHNNLH